jgi:hypothetical protein
LLLNTENIGGILIEDLLHILFAQTQRVAGVFAGQDLFVFVFAENTFVRTTKMVAWLPKKADS